MNRSEHLKWCKDRAIEYVDCGNLSEALASMASDLNKHPETQRHVGIELGMAQLKSGNFDAEQVRNWIQGFN